MEVVFELDELLHLAFHQSADRHACPARHHLGDVLLGDLFLQHRVLCLDRVELLAGLLEGTFEIGDAAVAELRGLLEIGLAIDLAAELIELFVDGLQRLDGVLLRLPPNGEPGEFLLEVGDLAVEILEPFCGNCVGLLGEGEPLDLNLADASLHDVDLGRHRVDLDPKRRARLVDEVDRLVGKVASGEIAIAEYRRSDERRVLDADAVMNLVALFEAAQDRHRGLDRRWFDQHLLKASLESRVLLDVLAVLVERGGAHHSQTAPGEHRLQHVAGVHCAVGAAACTHDRVHLVDERDDLTVGVLDLLEHRLQSLLELTAVLGAGDHGGEIETDEPLVLEARGYVTFDDALGKPLDDGGLADTRLADQHRVVLRATTQHADHPADLLIATDHRIEFALAGPLGEVETEPLERLVLILRVLAGDAMASPHLAKRGE